MRSGRNLRDDDLEDTGDMEGTEDQTAWHHFRSTR
jgi:hypothetical protein